MKKPNIDEFSAIERLDKLRISRGSIRSESLGLSDRSQKQALLIREIKGNLAAHKDRGVESRNKSALEQYEARVERYENSIKREKATLQTLVSAYEVASVRYVNASKLLSACEKFMAVRFPSIDIISGDFNENFGFTTR